MKMEISLDTANLGRGVTPSSRGDGKATEIHLTPLLQALLHSGTFRAHRHLLLRASFHERAPHNPPVRSNTCVTSV